MQNKKIIMTIAICYLSGCSGSNMSASSTSKKKEASTQTNQSDQAQKDNPADNKAPTSVSDLSPWEWKLNAYDGSHASVWEMIACEKQADKKSCFRCVPIAPAAKCENCDPPPVPRLSDERSAEIIKLKPAPSAVPDLKCTAI